MLHLPQLDLPLSDLTETLDRLSVKWHPTRRGSLRVGTGCEVQLHEATRLPIAVKIVDQKLLTSRMAKTTELILYTQPFHCDGKSYGCTLVGEWCAARLSLLVICCFRPPAGDRSQVAKQTNSAQFKFCVRLVPTSENHGQQFDGGDLQPRLYWRTKEAILATVQNGGTVSDVLERLSELNHVPSRSLDEKVEEKDVEDGMI